jgi:hypothetical protein
MATNPSKGVKRQQYQSSEQDILNQSYDPNFATLVFQLMGSPDGTNLYGMKVNSDGSMASPGLIPYQFDRIDFSNADSNGNYQTGTIKKSGTTIGTLTFAYDANSNITSVARS